MVGDRPLLDARGLTKAFGGARALNEVDLTVLPGEVHGLLGENGSGKSTLIKILAGYHTPDAGELFVNGREVPLPLGPGEPQRLGMEFVHQDLGLVASLTVAENFYMADIAKPSRRFFVSWSRRAAQAREVFARYGVTIDPDATIDGIRPVERALRRHRAGPGRAAPGQRRRADPAGARRAHRLPPGERGGAAVRPRPPDRRARVERAVRVARPGRGARRSPTA